MVEETSNVCENVVVWDGNPDTWAPPPNYLMLVQATTPAKVWFWDSVNQIWILEVQNGTGQIGFTWDGTYLTTNEPQPTNPPASSQAASDQANVSGAQTL
jgi:hypothetical protein